MGTRLVCTRIKLSKWNNGATPSKENLKFLAHIPKSLGGFAPKQAWVDNIISIFKSEYENMEIGKVVESFLKIVRSFPLYGMEFFKLQSVSDPRITGPCLLGVSKDGVHFMSPDMKEEIFSFSYAEIVSTRRLGLRTKDAHFIDFKVGNLMVQRVTRCQTRHSLDLLTLIDKYKDLYFDNDHEE